MELEGCKLCFQYLTKVGLAIKVFVSDRHRGIAKWIREHQPTVKHYFDQWHVAKGLVKKLLAASKLKGCEVISEWIKAVKNHIFWCSTSTKADFPEMILAKWNHLCATYQINIQAILIVTLKSVHMMKT